MNEAGVLGRFVPDFGRVVSMMQFNMYHHFTVDEHLIRTVGVLSDIERGEAAESASALDRSSSSHPAPARALRGRLPARHRQGPRRGPFASSGARIARSLCPRFGLTPAETETVAWLIEQHLTMSQVAFSRDIGDPKTIRDFANIVQSPERLKLLLVLTVADIRAVGPGIWNGWKGQLLRALYFETEPVVAGGHTQLGVARARRRGPGWHSARPLPTGPRRTSSASSTATIPTTGCRPRRARRWSMPRWCALPSGRAPSSRATSPPTPSRPSPSSRCWRPTIRVCWRCSRAHAPPAGANISGAHISTTRDGFALDTFLLAREFDQDEDELRRARRIAETIEKLLKGEVRLEHLDGQAAAAGAAAASAPSRWPPRC